MFAAFHFGQGFDSPRLHHFYIFQRFIFWWIEPNACASGFYLSKTRHLVLFFRQSPSSSWICLSLGTVVRYTASWLTSYLAFRTISFQSCRPSANPLHHFYIFQRFIFWWIELNACASGFYLSKSASWIIGSSKFLHSAHPVRSLFTDIWLF